MDDKGLAHELRMDVFDAKGVHDGQVEARAPLVAGVEVEEVGGDRVLAVAQGILHKEVDADVEACCTGNEILLDLERDLEMVHVPTVLRFVKDALALLGCEERRLRLPGRD